MGGCQTKGLKRLMRFNLLLDGETFYFWCSEKSKLLGSDLLLKMKNLLKGKSTLVELTGISESRLECFETHLHSYLLGPNVRVDGFEVGRNTQSLISVRSLSYKTECLKENVRRRGDLHLPVGSSFMDEAVLNLSKEVKPSEAFKNNVATPLSFLESP
ncbi:Polyribonucleotide nucleotidyltransferase [Bienertia sinuspersici]